MKRPAAALPSAKSKPVAKDGAVGATRAATKRGAAECAVSARDAGGPPHKQVLKKPVKWQSWAQDGSEENEQQIDGKDTSALSKQQRHVWDRAVQSENLPSKVQEQWTALKGSSAPGIAKERAAFVNALVPKNVGYGSLVDFSEDSKVDKICKLFRTKKGITEENLEDQTAIECRLGGGDMDRGAKNLQIGLSRGHIIQVRDGVYKTVVNKAIDEVSDSVGMQCSQAGHASEMKALIDKLERAGWAVWALETSDKISPVAMGKVADQDSVAMAELQEAFDMITSVSRQVRSTMTSARQQGLLIDSKDTLAKLGKELLQLCKIMEDFHMQ